MPIPVDLQLAVTIWRLATNVEYHTISALLGIGISTICDIVHQSCRAMAEHLLHRYVKLPSEEGLKNLILCGVFPRLLGL